MALVTGDCVACGHSWALHPVAADVRVCAECIYEEDYGRRSDVEMCTRVSPALDALAGTLVSIGLGRDFLGRVTVVLTDVDGRRWRTVHTRSWVRGTAERRKRVLARELESLTLLDFWREHQDSLR